MPNGKDDATEDRGISRRNFIKGLGATAIGAGVLNRPVTSFAKPSKKNVLTVVQGIDPETLDPHNDTLGSSESVFANLFSRLIRVDWKKGGPVPDLATSWKRIAN